MKFSSLTVVDLAENENVKIENAAKPANSANPVDLTGFVFANPLLIGANFLLIGTEQQPLTAKISSGLAKISSGLASEDYSKNELEQEHTGKLAGLAGLAGSEKPKNIDFASVRCGECRHSILSPDTEPVYGWRCCGLSLEGGGGFARALRRCERWESHDRTG